MAEGIFKCLSPFVFPVVNMKEERRKRTEKNKETSKDKGSLTIPSVNFK